MVGIFDLHVAEAHIGNGKGLCRRAMLRHRVKHHWVKHFLALVLLLLVTLVFGSIPCQAQGTPRQQTYKPAGLLLGTQESDDVPAKTILISGTTESRTTEATDSRLQCTGLHLFASEVTLPVLNFPVVLDLRNPSSSPIVLKSSSLAFFAIDADHLRRDVTPQVYAEPDPKNPQTVAPKQTVQLKFQLQLFHDAPTGRLQVEPRITWVRQDAADASSAADRPAVSQLKLYVDGILRSTTAFSDAWKATGHSQIGRGLYDGKPVDFAQGTINDARAYRRALSAAEVHSLFAQGPGAHWQFDQSTSDLNAPGNQGTLVGGVSVLSGQSALSLDGKSGYVDIHQGVLDTSQSYTVSAWVKMVKVDGYQTFVSQDGVQISGFYLQKRGDDNKLAFTRMSADTLDAPVTKAESSFAPQANVLYHLVGVYESAAPSATPAPVAAPVQLLETVSSSVTGSSSAAVLTVTAPAGGTPEGQPGK